MGDKETVGPEKRDSGLVPSKVRDEFKVLREKAEESLQTLKKPEKTQLFKSMFRVKHDDSERSRALSVLTNVFFHLHPAKIIATPCAIATRGAWAASASICLSS